MKCVLGNTKRSLSPRYLDATYVGNHATTVPTPRDHGTAVPLPRSRPSTCDIGQLKRESGSGTGRALTTAMPPWRLAILISTSTYVLSAAIQWYQPFLYLHHRVWRVLRRSQERVISATGLFWRAVVLELAIWNGGHCHIHKRSTNALRVKQYG